MRSDPIQLLFRWGLVRLSYERLLLPSLALALARDPRANREGKCIPHRRKERWRMGGSNQSECPWVVERNSRPFPLLLKRRGEERRTRKMEKEGER